MNAKLIRPGSLLAAPTVGISMSENTRRILGLIENSARRVVAEFHYSSREGEVAEVPCKLNTPPVFGRDGVYIARG